MIVIHPTTLGRLDCSLQYWFSRNYKSLITSEHYEFGLAVHYAMEKYYGEGEDLIEAFEEYMNKEVLMLPGDKRMALGIAMLNNYVDHYQGDEHLEVIATELEVARKVPVPADDPHPPKRAKEFYVAARIDAIVYDENLGQSFVMEHKTFSKFFPAQLSRDHQFIIECFVANGCSEVPVDGVIYNGLRKSAKPGKTTKLFERHTLYIDDASTEIMLHRVYWELMRISSDSFHAYPEPSTMKCNFCDFKVPCNEYMHGGDYKFTLNNLYARREKEASEWS